MGLHSSAGIWQFIIFFFFLRLNSVESPRSWESPTWPILDIQKARLRSKSLIGAAWTAVSRRDGDGGAFPLLAIRTFYDMPKLPFKFWFPVQFYARRISIF